jgi:hypothetical protein
VCHKAGKATLCPTPELHYNTERLKLSHQTPTLRAQHAAEQSKTLKSLGRTFHNQIRMKLVQCDSSISAGGPPTSKIDTSCTRSA